MPDTRFQTSFIDRIVEDGGDPNTASLAGAEAIVSVTIAGRTFLYQASSTSAGIGRFEFANDQVTALGIQSMGITDQTPRALTTAEIGGKTYLYAAENGLEVFEVGSDGTLTSVQTDNTLGLTGTTQGITVATVGGSAYLVITDQAAAAIRVAPIGSDGTVGGASGTVTQADDLPGSLDGVSLPVVAHVGGNTIIYTSNLVSGDYTSAVLNPNGTLSNPIEHNIGGAFSGTFEAVEVDGASYILINSSTGVFTYEIAANGALTFVDSATNEEVFGAGDNPGTLQASAAFTTSDGRVLVMLHEQSDEAALIEIESGGTIRKIEDLDSGPGPIGGGLGQTVFTDGKSAFFASTLASGISVHKVTTGADVVAVAANVDLIDTMVAPGDTADFRFPLVNAGDLATPTGVDIDLTFFLSTDQVLDQQTDRAIYSSFHSELAVSEVDDFTFDVGIPSNVLPGTYFLFGVADVNNHVDEADETNNTTAPYRLEVSFFTQDDDTFVIPLTGGINKTLNGNDTVTGTTGVDSIFGGSGRDQLSGLASADDLRGGDNNDHLYGNGGADALAGGNGNDSLFGGGGEDVMEGGAGRDDLNGGSGDDHLIGNGGSDTLSGVDGADLMFGGSGGDMIDGGQKADEIYGGGGRDTLDGGLSRDLVYGGDSGDMLDGGGSRDALLGDAGQDTLRGEQDVDALFGGGSDDTLFGGSGADDLIGGRGVDDLRGGSGRDTFIWLDQTESGETVNSADVVGDFERGSDKIDLSFVEGGIITEDILVQISMGTYTGGSYENGDEDAVQLHFIGQDDFSGESGTGEVRWQIAGDDVRVRVDISGNGTSDLDIIVSDVSNLSASDFVL